MRHPRLTIQHPETQQFESRSTQTWLPITRRCWKQARSWWNTWTSATTTLWLSLHWQCIALWMCTSDSSGIVRAEAPPDAALNAPRSFFRESLLVRHLARRRAQPRFEARAEELPPALFRGACFHEPLKPEVSDPCTIKKDETRRTMTLINLFLRLLHVFHIMKTFFVLGAHFRAMLLAPWRS